MLGPWRSSLLLALWTHYLVCVPAVLPTLAQLFNQLHMCNVFISVLYLWRYSQSSQNRHSSFCSFACRFHTVWSLVGCQSEGRLVRVCEFCVWVDGIYRTGAWNLFYNPSNWNILVLFALALSYILNSWTKELIFFLLGWG